MGSIVVSQPMATLPSHPLHLSGVVCEEESYVSLSGQGSEVLGVLSPHFSSLAIFLPFRGILDGRIIGWKDLRINSG